MKSLLIGLSLASVMLGTSAHAAPANFLVVPGQRIGQTPLGPQGSHTLAHLPPPYRADAGMSQRYFVWVSPASSTGHRNTLFIHATLNGALNVQPLNGLTFDVIRVTSPVFHTASGAASGSTFAQIHQRFPQAASVSNQPAIYDDVQHGIAFEFAHIPNSHSRCIAVMVHPSGQSYLANAAQVQDLLQSPPP